MTTNVEPELMTNWYATRLHYIGHRCSMFETTPWRALCGQATGMSLEQDAAYRASHGRPAKNYWELPVCTFCAAKWCRTHEDQK